MIISQNYIVYHTIEVKKQINIIYQYIKNFLYNPQAAQRFINNVTQRIDILTYFPQAGPKYKNTPYRYLTMKHWLIIYEVQGYKIEIIQIINSKQNSNLIF